MKSISCIFSVAATLALSSLNASAAEFEQVTGGPAQIFSQKSGDSTYTIFKFSLSGGVFNSTSKVFPTGSASVSECIGYSKTEKGNSSVESHCTTNYADGSVSVSESYRNGAVGQTTNGKQSTHVVSGPNSGATSECTFTPKYSKGSEGTYLIVHAKCTTDK